MFSSNSSAAKKGAARPHSDLLIVKCPHSVIDLSNKSVFTVCMNWSVSGGHMWITVPRDGHELTDMQRRSVQFADSREGFSFSVFDRFSHGGGGLRMTVLFSY